MRRKGTLLIADADTIILSCNGHALNMPMVRGQEVDLEALMIQFPYDPQQLEDRPTQVPDGWTEHRNLSGPKEDMRCDFSWCEDVATHEPLGWSATRRDKRDGKVFSRDGEVAVDPLKTDSKG